MYTVSYGEEEVKKESRAEAVEMARTLSSEGHGRVVVADADNVQRLVYVRGVLDSFTAETRARRKGGRRDDERESFGAGA